MPLSTRGRPRSTESKALSINRRFSGDCKRTDRRAAAGRRGSGQPAEPPALAGEEPIPRKKHREIPMPAQTALPARAFFILAVRGRAAK